MIRWQDANAPPKLKRPATSGRNTCRLRGWALMSILVYISILVIFLVAVSEVFDSSFRIMRTVRQWRETTMAVDGAIELLRDDVWNAQRAFVTSPGQMVINLSEQEVVVWRLQLPVEKKHEPQPRPEDGHYVRQLLRAGELVKERHFPMNVTALRFESDDAGLVSVYLSKPVDDNAEAKGDAAKPDDQTGRLHLPNLRQAVRRGL